MSTSLGQVSMPPASVGELPLNGAGSKLQMCDRCHARPATTTVRCWVPCEHHQCKYCAEQTALEAAEDD